MSATRPLVLSLCLLLAGLLPAGEAHGKPPLQPYSEVQADHTQQVPGESDEPGTPPPSRGGRRRAGTLALVPSARGAGAPSTTASRLRAAGWTFGALGAAGTIAGLVLLPLDPEGLPRTTGVVPLLAGGAGLLLLSRVLFSLAEQPRSLSPP